MTTTFNKRIMMRSDIESLFQRMLDNHIAKNGFDIPDWLSRKWVRFAKKKGIDFDDHYSRSDMMDEKVILEELTI